LLWRTGSLPKYPEHFPFFSLSREILPPYCLMIADISAGQLIDMRGDGASKARLYGLFKGM
jgi:hypothetical protein